jgi:hypothetical protein
MKIALVPRKRKLSKAVLVAGWKIKNYFSVNSLLQTRKSNLVLIASHKFSQLAHSWPPLATGLLDHVEHKMRLTVVSADLPQVWSVVPWAEHWFQIEVRMGLLESQLHCSNSSYRVPIPSIQQGMFSTCFFFLKHDQFYRPLLPPHERRDFLPSLWWSLLLLLQVEGPILFFASSFSSFPCFMHRTVEHSGLYQLVYFYQLVSSWIWSLKILERELERRRGRKQSVSFPLAPFWSCISGNWSILL